MSQFRRGLLIRLLGLAGLGLTGGCRSLPQPPTAPQRVSVRATLDAPIAAPTSDRDALDRPLSAQHAAERGLVWLMENPARWREGPYPVAVTAMAICAAVRDPRMQSDAEFRAFWLDQITYLVSGQDREGRLSAARATALPYEHAWATRALCDALPWAPEVEAWQQAAHRAVAYILDRQQPGGGWQYGYATGRQRSTPLSVVQMDALFAARRSGIQHPDIDVALQRAADDLEGIQDPQSGHFGYLMRGVGTGTMDGYALYGLQLAGRWRSVSYRRGWQARHESTAAWPESLQYPLFAAYYSHKSALWQGGLPWRDWAERFYAELLAGQRDDGSWAGPRQEAALGKAYATALSSLMLNTVHPQEIQHPTRPPAPLPGPVYRVQGPAGSATVILSTWIESMDAVLLDPVIAGALQAADAVWVEGSPRAWLHHWTEQAAADSGGSRHPRSRQQVAFLRNWFEAPIGTPQSLWEEIPPWALAIAVLGRGLEQADRSLDATVETAIARRLRPGMRTLTMLPDDTYGKALVGLSMAQQGELLDQAIRMAPHLAHWSDMLADAWCRGDEAELIRLHDELFDAEPELRPLISAITSAARARILLQILDALRSDKATWFVIPTWHWFGDQGLKQELERQGFQLIKRALFE